MQTLNRLFKEVYGQDLMDNYHFNPARARAFVAEIVALRDQGMLGCDNCSKLRDSIDAYVRAGGSSSTDDASYESSYGKQVRKVTRREQRIIGEAALVLTSASVPRTDRVTAALVTLGATLEAGYHDWRWPQGFVFQMPHKVVTSADAEDHYRNDPLFKIATLRFGPDVQADLLRELTRRK